MPELFGPKTEEKILNFWKENQTFEKSLALRRAQGKAKKFVFFEGPPSANARPHIGHVLGRCYKDIICRYKTMRGFDTLGRHAGWDTHGLPIEVQLEKRLGFKNKSDIEKYGIAKFNTAARDMVWEYKKEWDDLTERMGFWIDLAHPYITYDPHYIESLWHLISKIAAKKLLYQDFKVVPYCPRCGTPLSSFEVAQGYETTKDQSVFVKFKVKSEKLKVKEKENENEYFLVWTTTPWTLPANVALAVGKNIDYVKIKTGDEIFFLASARLSVVKEPYEVIEKIKGQKLIGLNYEPLYKFQVPSSKFQVHRVVAGDFVSTEDGTGIVHIAPAFGEDDMNVAKSENLPVIHNVDLEGKFKKEVKPWAGKFVKDADPLIIKELEARGALYKKELYEHEYPFCWRCKTPLLYYAKSSWFIRMEKLREKLITNNQKINWIPSHIKQGRFGEWLREVKDWAFSRERFWGTPLPVWSCVKCKKEKVIGSLAELDRLSGRKMNSYIFLRHGEAESNRVNIISSWPELKKYPLTLNGVQEIERIIPWFKKQKIDLVFSSDLLRAKETAQIVSKALNKKIIFDKRLREHDFGILNGHIVKEWHALYDHKKENQYIFKSVDGENLKEVQIRMMDFVKSLDKKYEGKKILVVSHGNPIWATISAYQGYNNEEASALHNRFCVDGTTGSTFEMSGHNWPYNENGDLDLHRPHVDHLVLKCPSCAGEMKRVKEVIDVWFDSGAMPFAQYHWPFAQTTHNTQHTTNNKFNYPADFISEGVDQTRGWFYTLHAVGALMDKGPAFKNVISLGHVLDEKGEKMSKSKGNVVDPMEIINKYGIDALRWYFFTVNPPGEPKRFVARDVEEKMRRFILTFWNVLAFYATYEINSKIKNSPYGRSPEGRQNSKLQVKIQNFSLLDKWILSRLNDTIKTVRQNLDEYEVTQAARAVDNLIDDISRWWLRRSRKRFPDDKNASAVLRELLESSAKMLAPFTPFLAEAIWQELGHKESVHLADYPGANKEFIDKNLEDQMRLVQNLSAQALALRAKAGIKVRQPLASLKIENQKFSPRKISRKETKIKISDELLNLIKNEVNVKEIVFGDAFELDTKITAELKEEGIARDLVRQIQDMRRDAGLVPQNKIKVYFKTDFDDLEDLIKRNQNYLKNEVGAVDLEFVGALKEGLLIDRHIQLENHDLWIGIAL